MYRRRVSSGPASQLAARGAQRAERPKAADCETAMAPSVRSCARGVIACDSAAMRATSPCARCTTCKGEQPASNERDRHRSMPPRAANEREDARVVEHRTRSTASQMRTSHCIAKGESGAWMRHTAYGSRCLQARITPRLSSLPAAAAAGALPPRWLNNLAGENAAGGTVLRGGERLGERGGSKRAPPPQEVNGELTPVEGGAARVRQHDKVALSWPCLVARAARRQRTARRHLARSPPPQPQRRPQQAAPRPPRKGAAWRFARGLVQPKVVRARTFAVAALAQPDERGEERSDELGAKGAELDGKLSECALQSAHRRVHRVGTRVHVSQRAEHRGVRQKRRARGRSRPSLHTRSRASRSMSACMSSSHDT